MKILWLSIIWTLLFFSSLSSALYNSHISQSHDQGVLSELPAAQRKTAAHLLVDKRLLNKHLVESMDIVIEYRIYNIGFQAATDVHLRDASFEDNSKFVVVGGLTNVLFGRIPPGESVSHTLVVRPLYNGAVEFEPAEIRYRWGKEDMTAVGTSSEPGTRLIFSTKAFHRQFSPHFEEWSVFAILSLPSLLVPYMLWFASKSKNESLIKEAGGFHKRQMLFYRNR